MRKFLLAALALSISTTVQAHEIWIERDASGPARIYLGEPEFPLPEGGDPAFPQLKTPKLVPASSVEQVRGAGYIEVAVPGGDVRAWDDDIFAPWDEDGKKAGGIYYARAGRTDTRAMMPAEIVPVEANGTRFVLIKDGKPAPGVAIRVLSPEKWSKNIKTDATGVLTVPIRESGRYLMAASMKDEGEYDLPGGKVNILHRITTTTFLVP